VSLLLPTDGGRVLRFDSSTNALTTDFANGLGTGLLKIKVGTYSTFPYAFVAQSTPGTGRILQFGAPPVSGANNPLSSVSTALTTQLSSSKGLFGLRLPVVICVVSWGPRGSHELGAMQSPTGSELDVVTASPSGLLTVAAGGTVKLTAMASYSYGPAQDVTSSASWASRDERH
jgi:hypothetical protein